MDKPDPIQRAVDMVGLSKLARECQVTHQAVRKWQRQGRMPRTEWTGETRHAERIQQATSGAVTRDELLQGWRAATPAPAQQQEACSAA